jgi:hypothetical protein
MIQGAVSPPFALFSASFGIATNNGTCTMFDRMISVDWSGAGKETKRVDLRIAKFDAALKQPIVVRQSDQSRSWTRSAFQSWITAELRDKQPTLVVMDFGFGFPWGSDQAVFGVVGWRAMISAIAKRYEENETACATADSINSNRRFRGHGPYRFDSNRNDFRFYADNGIAYYRLTELVAPQAISQWYFGPGGRVGFSTITGLSAIHHLVLLREAGDLDFYVWPHECLSPDGTKHVIAESYPALCSYAGDFGPCCDPHERDAWKVIKMLMMRRNEGNLRGLFQVREQPFGRISGVYFQQQIQLEGYIVGLT